VLAASELQAEHALPLTLTELLSSSVRQRPLGTGTGQLAQSEAILSRTPMLMVRHAQDAVFEEWDNGLLDVLA
jgi:hypothetical protein